MMDKREGEDLEVHQLNLPPILSSTEKLNHHHLPVDGSVQSDTLSKPLRLFHCKNPRFTSLTSEKSLCDIFV